MEKIVYNIIEIISEVTSGANKPFIAIGVNEDGEEKNLVIKIKASERMNSVAFIKEFYGSHIALELGLSTPIPIIANISTELCNAYKNTEYYNRLSKSLGLNFATEYLPNIEIYGSFTQNKSKSIIDKMLKVYYFDLLIQNVDRTFINGKPNLFTISNDLYIIDHELGFSFLDVIIGRVPSKPFEFNAQDKIMTENHIFYKQLKGKNLNFSILAKILNPINSEFWQKLRHLTPIDWLNENDIEINKIIDHIDTIKANNNLFIENIKKILT